MSQRISDQTNNKPQCNRRFQPNHAPYQHGMRWLALLAGLLVLSPLLPDTAQETVCAAPAAEATKLTFTAEQLDVKKVTDGSYYSVATVRGGSGCVLNTNAPAQGIYLEWHRAPGAYSILQNGETITVTDGCLHQYVPLDGCTSVQLLPAADTELAECSLWPEGTLPAQVQTWQPVLERADLLVFPTHADDELLMFGGTLPYYAGECGLAVQVAYLTHHWAETARPHELLNGLWETGVRAYPIISPFADVKSLSLEGAKRTYDDTAVLGYQVEVIRRVKPSVIIGHDINGEYGHGAHMLNAHLLQSAVTLCADATQYSDSATTYGIWEVQKLYLHLWKEHTIEMNWERPLSAFGGMTARAAAAQGYAKHQSQQRWGYSVHYEGVWDCRQFGLFHTTVGYDTEADFMQHIVSVQTEAAEQAAKEEAARQSAIAATATTATTTTTTTASTAQALSTTKTVQSSASLFGSGGAWLLLGSLAVGLLLVLWLWIGSRLAAVSAKKER